MSIAMDPANKITPGLACDYSKKIISSAPTERVFRLMQATRENMSCKNSRFADMGSVLNEKTSSLPLIIRKAMAERQKLEAVPVGIWDDQVFAGCFTIAEKHMTISYDLPVFAKDEERLEGEKYGFGIYSMFGHIAPDYPRLLSLGASGIIDMAKKRMNEASSEKSRAFLQAAVISMEGLVSFARRHAQLLHEKASALPASNKRRHELLRAADALGRCPEYPAETFIEACQAMWLCHLALQLTGNYLAIGRPDQFLYPYLKSDLEKGLLSLEEAQELTDLFMLKFNERAQDNEIAAEQMDLEAMQAANEKKWRERKLYDIGQQRYNVRDTVDAVNHWNQNIMLGGVIPGTGEDAVNILSVMMLESFRRLRMTNPVTSVRINARTPDYFLNQTALTLKTGGGLPAIYNDDVIIKAYENFGFDSESARDFGNNGCWEAILPGRTDFYFIKVNALKCLEWSLNRGACHVDEKREAPDQGDPALWDFEELYSKFLENLRYVMENAAKHMIETQEKRSIAAPTPLLSGLLQGPIENGRDMTEMGARDIVGGTIAEGFSHTIDSLCAIRKTVFTDNFCSMADVVKAIDCNFHGSAALRAKLASCPKYGCNDPVADAMAFRVTNDYASIMKDIDENHPEMKFMPGIGTFSWYIAVGEGTGASADGRLSGEPVASNFSPSAGAMAKGVTGAIKSFCKMCHDMIPLGSPLDIGMSEKYAAGDAGTARLVGLLKSFCQMSGNLLTISVADADILRDAQKHPERYKDLRVRMGGWSAYFTMLSKEQQDHHIKKSEAGIF
ncbi:MAG: hypothetical protein LBU32_26655 [Clostridiales bacterium]|jgi:formate C-acetyltransferase|nr:hypothetical protein [Clostridiales bacterium]